MGISERYLGKQGHSVIQRKVTMDTAPSGPSMPKRRCAQPSMPPDRSAKPLSHYPQRCHRLISQSETRVVVAHAQSRKILLELRKFRIKVLKKPRNRPFPHAVSGPQNRQSESHRTLGEVAHIVRNQRLGATVCASWWGSTSAGPMVTVRSHQAECTKVV